MVWMLDVGDSGLGVESLLAGLAWLASVAWHVWLDEFGLVACAMSTPGDLEQCWLFNLLEASL